MTVASGRAGTFRWDAGRVLMLITLCTTQLIASIDVTVVNVALPAISSGLASTTRTCSGPCLPTSTMAAVAGLGPEQAGVAAGLANATRTVGGALGLAGVSAVVASHASAGPDARSAGLRRLRRSPRRCRSVSLGLFRRR